MKEELYRLIPEEGKHLAESHDTEGAFRGVYLDDETNRPSGAGEFIKVDLDDFEDAECNPDLDTEESSNAAGNATLIAFGAFIGAVVTIAYPHVRKWVKEKVVPSVRSCWNKLRGKEEPPLLQKPDDSIAVTTTVKNTTSIDVAFSEYRENMSNEEAQRELIEAFVLYLVSMKKVHRVSNANIIDSEGKITDGRMLIETLASKGMIESINEILFQKPEILDQKQEALLSEVLGYHVINQDEFIPITVEALSAGLLSE